MAIENGKWIMRGMDWDDPARIQSWEELIRWVDEIGFLPLFQNEIDGFSVEENTADLYWWTGNPDQDPWEWRALIARSGRVAYGKFFGKRAGFIPYTSSANDLLKAVTALYDRIVDKNLLIRRLSISANKLLDEASALKEEPAEQLDLFTDYASKEKQEQADKAAHTRERKLQEAMLGIKKKYGKNAILKGMNLEEGATARERNQTIGGHQA